MTTSSIGSGQTYTTVQLWEDDCPANITATGTNEDWIGEVHGNLDSGSSRICSFSGITTDATHRVILQPASGQAFYEHANVATNPLRFSTSYGAAIQTTRGWSDGISTADGTYVLIRGLNIRNDQGNGTMFAMGNRLLIDRCIVYSGNALFKDEDFGAGSYNDHRGAHRSLLMASYRIISGRYINLRQCTVRSLGSADGLTRHYYGGCRFYNTLFISNSQDIDSSPAAEAYHCATNRANLFCSPETNCHEGITSGDHVEAIGSNHTNIDARMKATSTLYDQGQDLSGFFTTDIRDQAITDWPIGADGIPAAGGTNYDESINVTGTGSVTVNDQYTLEHTESVNVSGAGTVSINDAYTLEHQESVTVSGTGAISLNDVYGVDHQESIVVSGVGAISLNEQYGNDYTESINVAATGAIAVVDTYTFEHQESINVSGAGAVALNDVYTADYLESLTITGFGDVSVDDFYFVSGGGGLTLEQWLVLQDVWAALYNRRTRDPETGVITIYEDDGITVRKQFDSDKCLTEIIPRP